LLPPRTAGGATKRATEAIPSPAAPSMSPIRPVIVGADFFLGALFFFCGAAFFLIAAFFFGAAFFIAGAFFPDRIIEEAAFLPAFLAGFLVVAFLLAFFAGAAFFADFFLAIAKSPISLWWKQTLAAIVRGAMENATGKRARFATWPSAPCGPRRVVF
jgi:hypothetical protein